MKSEEGAKQAKGERAVKCGGHDDWRRAAALPLQNVGVLLLFFCDIF